MSASAGVDLSAGGRFEARGAVAAARADTGKVIHVEAPRVRTRARARAVYQPRKVRNPKGQALCERNSSTCQKMRPGDGYAATETAELKEKPLGVKETTIEDKGGGQDVRVRKTGSRHN